MNCQFCLQPCQLQDKSYGQWCCSKCSVQFVERLDSNQIVYKLTAFTKYNDDQSKWTLSVNYYTNYTTLVWHPPPNHPTIYCKSVVTLHRVMKGITPQNIHDKIQTLLVFS